MVFENSEMKNKTPSLPESAKVGKEAEIDSIV